MTMLDWVLILLIGAGVAQGYASGLIRQIASFLGIIVGLLFGLSLMTEAGLIVAHSLGLSPRIAPVVGFLLVFGVVQLATFALVRLGETVIGTFKMTLLNHAGGAALGAFKAALLASVVLLPLGFVGVPGTQAQQQSVLYEPVATLMPATWSAIARHTPHINNVRATFEDAAEQLRQRLAADAAPRT